MSGLYGNTFIKESVIVSEDNIIDFYSELSLLETTIKQDILFESLFDEIDSINESENQENKQKFVTKVKNVLITALNNFIKFLKSIKDKIKDFFSKFFKKSKELDKSANNMEIKNFNRLEYYDIVIEYDDYIGMIKDTDIQFTHFVFDYNEDYEKFDSILLKNKLINIFKKSYKNYFQKIDSNSLTEYISSYHTIVESREENIKNIHIDENYKIIKNFENDLNRKYKQTESMIDENINHANDMKSQMEDSIKIINKIKLGELTRKEKSDKGNILFNIEDNIPLFIKFCTNLSNMYMVVLKEMCYICMKAKSENFKIKKEIKKLYNPE